MPALNFQERWVGKVLAGTKRQTIRVMRKRPFKAGDMLYLYTAQRTPNCRKLGDAVCCDVARLSRSPVERWCMEGVLLSTTELREIAKADGFNSLAAFCEFFGRYKGGQRFQLIRWIGFVPAENMTQ